MAVLRSEASGLGKLGLRSAHTDGEPSVNQKAMTWILKLCDFGVLSLLGACWKHVHVFVIRKPLEDEVCTYRCPCLLPTQ